MLQTILFPVDKYNPETIKEKIKKFNESLHLHNNFVKKEKEKLICEKIHKKGNFYRVRQKEPKKNWFYTTVKKKDIEFVFMYKPSKLRPAHD